MASKNPSALEVFGDHLQQAKEGAVRRGFCP